MSPLTSTLPVNASVWLLLSWVLCCCCCGVNEDVEQNCRLVNVDATLRVGSIVCLLVTFANIISCGNCGWHRSPSPQIDFDFVNSQWNIFVKYFGKLLQSVCVCVRVFEKKKGREWCQLQQSECCLLSLYLSLSRSCSFVLSYSSFHWFIHRGG